MEVSWRLKIKAEKLIEGGFLGPPQSAPDTVNDLKIIGRISCSPQKLRHDPNLTVIAFLVLDAEWRCGGSLSFLFVARHFT